MARTMKIAALGSLLLTLLFAGAYLWQGRALWYSLAVTMGAVLYHLAMRLLVGGVFQAVMHNREDYRRAWYRQRPWEPKLYAALGVQKWKGRLPAYDPGLFDPRLHSWEEIAQAMCQAELVHETIALFSLVPIAAGRPFGAFPVFLITSLLSAGLDLLFVILQRYNRPRVLRLIDSLARKKPVSP